jgi:hypothetical protein
VAGTDSQVKQGGDQHGDDEAVLVLAVFIDGTNSTLTLTSYMSLGFVYDVILTLFDSTHFSHKKEVSIRARFSESFRHVSALKVPTAHHCRRRQFALVLLHSSFCPFHYTS